ncbi:MAG: MATE family efflux transporter [Corallococcus sp.]|nr:MATE family efflux transporter [Corallococcus sp.]
MMVFTSVYSVIDGLFVSNFAGDSDTPFAALNFIYPVIMVLGAVGFMFGAGGTAIVSKTLGEGHRAHANRYFTLIVAVTAVCGTVLGITGIFTVRYIAELMGATDEMLDYCIQYARIVLCALPCFMLQNLFQSFFITAEKPKLGFLFTVVSGVANILLDALFVAVLGMGLQGAAIATAISQSIGGLSPVIYFTCKNKSLLRFTKTKWYGRIVAKSCVNGSSELVGNIAMSLVSMIYNVKLLQIANQNGVSAFGVIMYVQFIFVAIFIGYCIGTAPIIGYNFGAQNREELQNIFKKSMIIICVVAVTMLALAESLADVISSLFFNDSMIKEGMSEETIESIRNQIEVLRPMTANGLRLYSVGFLFAGFNMFCSSMFTALNNGFVSAVSSFARTLIFQIVCIFLLPLWLGLDGVWLSTVAAEGLSAVLSAVLFAVYNRKYGYVKPRKVATKN